MKSKLEQERETLEHWRKRAIESEAERDELREALAIERTNRECWAGEAARYQKISDELRAEVERLKEIKDDLKENSRLERERAEAAEAKLEAVRGLIEKAQLAIDGALIEMQDGPDYGRTADGIIANTIALCNEASEHLAATEGGGDDK